MKLDGALLFATLEPCAPGARRHPKLSCAERIVLARIKEVWVGVEDPDPSVDRKGIKYLQDNGVSVHMFDRDLQEVIRSENQEFFTEACERADERKKAKLPVLSGLEHPVPAALEDFAEDALEQYRVAAGLVEAVGSEGFQRRLERQGFLKADGGKLRATGFGLLLFGKEPRGTMPQAGLLGTIHYPDGKEETRDFDGPMVHIPDQVQSWLRDRLPSVIDRTQMRRRQVPALPFMLVREAVVNALIHRDYDIVGGKCQLVVDADTVVVRSPGGPIPPITMQQLQAFNAPMLSRNPALHYVFARMRLAEERGLGLRSMKQETEKLGLPLPRYEFNDPYVVLTLFRSGEGAVRALPGEVLEALSREEQLGWQYVSSLTAVTATQYARRMKYTDRQARRHLRKFVDLGLLRRAGAGPQTEYRVIRP